MKRTLCLVLLLVGCRRHVARPVDAGAVPIVDAGVLDSGALDSGPPPHFTLATFGDNGLDSCVEILTPFQPGHDGGPPIPPGATRIDQTCADAFADRKELASCALPDFATDAGTFHQAIHYYDAVTLDTDRYMRECFEGHGTWKAVSREDQAYLHSRMQGHAKQLQRLGH